MSSDGPVPELPSVEGELPMFPLGSVLLPKQVLPLHIFEERYLEMMSVCLAGNKLFGVVLIERGSEVGGGDMRTDVGTLAEIVSHRSLDGPRQRMAVLAVGLSRLQVRRWLQDDPFPRAEVEPWPCELGSTGAVSWSDQFDSVVAATRRIWGLRKEMGANDPEVPDEIAQDWQGSFLLSNLIPLQQFDRQKLLEAPSVANRLQLLEELLQEQEQLLLANLNTH